MHQNNKNWNIRFGKIFNSLLAESGKKLEDYFYFIPDGEVLDDKNKSSFNVIDLSSNRTAYDAYFGNESIQFRELNSDTVKRLHAALVIVPGFGHHLIEQKAFGDQIPLLQRLGFTVVYARYEDSLESNENCAQRVYDIIQQKLHNQQPIIFITYSKGSPVIVELLSNSKYVDIINRTKAVVSFAGALRGSVLASGSSSKLTVRLLKAYRKFTIWTGITKTIAYLLAKLRIRTFREWNEVLQRASDFRDEIIDLPEGIIDLSRIQCKHNHAHIQLPNPIVLFSISAVYPESEFKNGLKFIPNPDDLFLYVAGKELYAHNVFNDLQLLLPDSKFFEQTGTIVDLGVVKADHWGIAMPRVFSRFHTDPFPRTELLKAVLIILDEYFSG